LTVSWRFLAPRSLSAIIAHRLALASLVALALQIVMVTVVTLRGKDELARGYVLTETKLLAEGLREDTGTLKFTLPQPARYYSDERAPSYAFRVMDADGRLIAESNAAVLAGMSPWIVNQSHASQFWYRREEPHLHMAGGSRVRVAGRDAYVEVATTGDPAGAHWRTIAGEIIEDALTPMVPLVLLLFLVTTTSIRWSLRPLSDAASKAEQLEEIGRERFNTEGMPLEAASFATAINRLLDRIAALVDAQSFFTARAAHELRTPLSIMLLELGRIGDSRARRLEADVTAMTGAVDRLLVLARLKSLQTPQLTRVDLAALAEDVVSQMKPWVTSNKHEINLTTPDENCEAYIDVVAIKEALRNLIDNAVKHTPDGTRISVTLAPNFEIAVEDNGPGLGTMNAEDLFEPFRKGSVSVEGSGLGLTIAKRAAELHGGSLIYEGVATGGVRITIKLRQPDSAT
jgi:signal transduction histidine kinase